MQILSYYSWLQSASASLSVKPHESASSDLVAMNISYWIDSGILKEEVVWKTRDLRAINF